MRTAAATVLFLCSLLAPVHAQFTDDFSDGDFITAPAWAGNEALFTIDAGRIRSNSPGAATYGLGTPSTVATEAQWEWWMDLRFSTSGANYVDVFVMSDASDPALATEGYFVRIGGATDRVELFRRSGGNTTSLVVSPDGIVNSSSSNPFRIRVVRDAADLWTLSYDDGATGTFTSAGSVTDNAVNSSAYFGLLIVQSSAAGPVNNHFFDDFVVSAIVPDTEAPSISQVVVVDADNIDVLFSEPVEAISANTASNYEVQPFLTATSAALDGVDPARVHLTLSSPLTNGNSYQLVVNSVADLAGNAIGSASFPFNYIVPVEAQPGDVVINEIMADPTPVVGLPEAEFIELHNTTTTPFALGGWTITDGSSTGTLPTFDLLPGAYVILASTTSASLFSSFGDVLAVPAFPSLNNDGDALVLRQGSGVDIDAVTYALAWYQDAVKEDGGWTLERINPTAPCSGAANWIASTNEDGGTPGTVNAVFDPTPDTQAPELVSVQVVSPTEIQLVFDETLDADAATSAVPVAAPALDVVGVQLVAPADDRLRLLLNTALIVGEQHTIRVENVMDCSGNVNAETITLPFQLIVPAAPLPGDVVINELMADPSPTVQLPDAEYVELHNTTTDKWFDLTGWRITTSSSQADLPAVVLAPGAYLAFVNSAQLPVFSGYPEVVGWSLSNTALINDGTVLTLEGPANLVLDVVPYASTWYRDEAKEDGGWSLERINPFAPCSDARNWVASNDERGGTPGQQNSTFDTTPDTEPPMLIGVQVISPTEVVLVFNEGLDAAAVGEAIFTIDPPLDLDQAQVIAPNDRIRLTLGEPMVEGTVHTVTVQNVADCSGNVSASATGQFALPQPVAVGDVVINEVLYDPVAGGSDFVELYNRSDKVLSLAGWKLANVSDGTIGNASTITETAQLLLPREYVWITEDGTGTLQRYPQSRADRSLEADLPSYNNGEGSVVLQDPSGNTLDRFDYDDDLHFELLNATEGVSLERVSPDRPTDDRTNWHSAAEDAGYATPGFVNSQFAPVPNASGELTIEPAIFSPDNDGHQDLLTITYRFDQPGFVATMKVFDVAGREVRTLMDNELLGTSGSVSWNGMMEANGLARMGPYVVYLEAYDLDGHVEKFRKTVVLAHRLND